MAVFTRSLPAWVAWLLLGAVAGDAPCSPESAAQGTCSRAAEGDDLADVSLLQKLSVPAGQVALEDQRDLAVEAAGRSQCEQVGARGWVSAKGINSVLETIFPVLMAKVPTLEIPEIIGEESGFSYNVSGIHLKHYHLDLPTVDFKEGVGINMKITGFHIDAAFHYKVESTSLPLWSSGRVRCELSQREDINGMATVAVDSNGKPQVTLDLGPTSFKIGGFLVEGSAFSGLIEFLVSIFEGKVEELVAAKAQEVVKTVANDYINEFLDQIDFQIPLPLPEEAGKVDAADMSLCFAEVGDHYLAVGVHGAIVDLAQPEKVSLKGAPPKLHQRPPKTLEADGRMVAVELTPWTLNSGLALIQTQGFLKKTVSTSDLSGAAGVRLDVKHAKSLVPQLSMPKTISTRGLNFAVDISSSEAPTVTFDDGAIALHGHVKMALRWEDSDEIFLTFTAPLAGAVSLAIEEGDEEEKVVVSIKSVSCTPIHITSGDLSANIAGLNTLVEVVLDNVLVPLANEMVKDGIALPTTDGMHLVGSKLALTPGYLHAVSDVLVDVDAFKDFADSAFGDR